jgi:hypothetical protein
MMRDRLPASIYSFLLNIEKYFQFVKTNFAILIIQNSEITAGILFHKFLFYSTFIYNLCVGSKASQWEQKEAVVFVPPDTWQIEAPGSVSACKILPRIPS